MATTIRLSIARKDGVIADYAATKVTTVLQQRRKKMKARNKQLEVFDDTRLGLSKAAYMAPSPQ